VRHSHKLGKGWSSEDGVVGGVEVGDVEVDVFDTEVIHRTELNRE
jgi:hypothetical protein